MPFATLEQLFVNYLIQGAVLGCAGLLLAGCAPRLARRYPPQWFSRAWAVLALLLVLPLGSLGAVRALAPVQVQTPAAWQEPIALPQATTADLAADAVTQHPQAVTGHPDTPLPLPEAPPRVAPAPLALLTGAWLAGMAGFLFWQGLGYLIWRRRALRLSCPVAEPWARAWADAGKEAPLHRPALLRQTPAVGSPVTAGLLRPVVLVPEQCPAPEAARMMLLHERTHLRRHDLALKVLLLLARALHWYNPAAALLARRAGRDMEAACDAQVVAGHSPRWRGVYGDALLTAARMGRAPALTTGFALGKGELKFRFARLWDAAPPRRGRLALAAVALSCLLCTGLIACTADTPAPVSTPAAQTDNKAGASPAADQTAAPVTDRSGQVQRDAATIQLGWQNDGTLRLPEELDATTWTLQSGSRTGDVIDLAMADGEGGVSFWHSDDCGSTYTRQTLDLTSLLGDGPFRVANYEQLTPDTGFLVIARESEAPSGMMTDKNLCFLRRNGGDWQLMSEQSCPTGTELGGWHTQPFYWMNENVGFWAPHTDYHNFDLWRTVDGGASWQKLDLAGLEQLVPYDQIPGLHTCAIRPDPLDPGPGHLQVHCYAAKGNATTQEFWLVSSDYGETWRVRASYRLDQNQGSPTWLPEFLLDAEPVAEGDTEELLLRLDHCRYLDQYTDGEPCLMARARTADGWQDAEPGTPGTLEVVYAPAAGGITAQSIRDGLASVMSDEACQVLLPGLWDGAAPTLLERDGQLYIRCASPCPAGGWLQRLSTYAPDYTEADESTPGRGQGGQGYGQGSQGGVRQRLRDGTGLCLDLGYTDGCWRLQSITEEGDVP